MLGIRLFARRLTGVVAGLAMLGLPLASAAAEVVIKRDTYGMPHVYANTTVDLFYGYGYVVAQDRLFQMEMARRSTQGRVAEVLGEKFVAFDQSIRGNFSPERIHAQIDALPQSERDILDGYAAGINAWLREVRADAQALMPKQFNDLAFAPADWSAYDVAMVFIGTMANRFSDSSGEIDNLAMLTALTDQHGKDDAWKIFNQLKWTTDPKALTTVPAEYGAYTVPLRDGSTPPPYALPRFDHTPPLLNRLALDPGSRALLGLSPEDNRAALLAQIEATGLQGTAGFPTTSNVWLVGKSRARGARSILVNGPQFGWFAPAYTYGIGLHGAGYDIVGNTPFAYPAILFGHNGQIAWGATAGVGDTVDFYAEQLDPADPTRYLHNGEWQTMSKRTETIAVKGGKPVTQNVYRTVHGIVTKIDTAHHVAYAKARTWEGHEVQSLLAWVHAGQARDWATWKQQAARQALTINWYYADHDGNIGYIHTGWYPQRQSEHDARLPVPGTGRYDWRGILPFNTNPQIYNPSQGYIANWNNAPMKGYPSTDLYAVQWTRADRLAEIETRLRDRLQRDGSIDAQDMWGLIEQTSYADVNRRHFLPFLQRAVAALPPEDARARFVDQLTQWDGKATDTAGTGFYDNAGPAMMDAWLRAMLKFALSADLPADVFKLYAATGYPTPSVPNAGSVNLAPGVKVLYNVLEGEAAGVPQRYDFLHGKPRDDVVREAIDTALAALKQQYGADPASWRIPVARLAFSANNFFGVPQASPGEARSMAVTMNRGTENNMIAFTPEGIRAVDVVAPGQSGLISPDGKAAAHTQDQLDLYVTFGSKPVWFTQDEVTHGTASVTRLQR